MNRFVKWKGDLSLYSYFLPLVGPTAIDVCKCIATLISEKRSHSYSQTLFGSDASYVSHYFAQQ